MANSADTTTHTTTDEVALAPPRARGVTTRTRGDVPGGRRLPRLETEMRIVRAVALLAFGLVAVSVPACSDGGGDGGHHDDTSAADATPNDSSLKAGGALEDVSVSDGVADASCSAACGAACCELDQACCLDQHGHNPSCVAGLQCVPPQQPIDGG